MPPERTPGGDPTELALRLRQGAAELGLVLPEPVLRRLLAMLELLRDPERCALIAAAAQKETDEKYNYRTLEKKINDVYAYVGSVSE